ncbi:hypothetical protein BVF91_11595 [Thermoanaerobacterium sp. PSU-2]|uniref:hypothetical protein n=1 Tax=Thermoanaerobacterium sp. PSU-2 TaxID=1930849 RepID=UPI000A15DE44|nr:hypothetical protein [Thermoanaerobacterium sp. PSU-2]ORX22477.1 hypothetical protein BVF91_11595 [Thermoanaerobacterium sp. PSU-2]
MRIVRDDDIREFVDENGDKLVTLAKVRKRDYDKRQQMIIDMADVNMADPTKPTIDSLKIDQQAINEFMFKTVAQKFVIAGQEITGDALLDTYRNLDVDSGNWVDNCIAEVWNEVPKKN